MMTINHVKIFAPATLANVGPGFDVLGIALDQPGDIVIAERKNEKGLSFSLHDASNPLPGNHKNVAAHVANLMLEEFNPPYGISMILQKNMPIGSGLGSSGASSAAAALAINTLLPKPLAKMDLVRFAMEGEMLASGSPHADNVAPALLGGACLIRSYHPLDILKLPVKNDLFWIVAHPHIEIQTQAARAILPEMIPLTIAVKQWGNLAGLITGLIQGDSGLVGRSLIDHIIEPVRAHLIPGFYEVKAAALTAGALGFSISGSGPSVFAVTPTRELAVRVATQIQKTFLTLSHIKCDIYISNINLEGANILEQSS
ncbi:MAG: homoserine kinase [Gammaproteobacteria bacterium]|nr:homoserine kinase [Gammaproteobacteria bacterium]